MAGRGLRGADAGRRQLIDSLAKSRTAPGRKEARSQTRGGGPEDERWRTRRLDGGQLATVRRDAERKKETRRGGLALSGSKAEAAVQSQQGIEVAGAEPLEK